MNLFRTLGLADRLDQWKAPESKMSVPRSLVDA